ncbi:hypothetical protein HZS_106 [Henneguya salminicola]|nr:hypothetical protein HZS_106 [Henneguya salminicola]
MSKVLIYSGSLGPNLNKNKSIAVKFEYPLNVSQVKIVPHARVCHEKFRQISKTSPSHFELDVFGRDTNQPSLSFLTDILIFRGDYDYISVNVYSKENNEIIENIKTDEANEDEIETIQQSKSTFVALNTQVDEYGDVETDNDSLMIGDIDFDNICQGESLVFEETWLYHSIQFNYLQALLSPINCVPHPSFNQLQKELNPRKNTDESKFSAKLLSSKVHDLLEILKNSFHENRWLFALEEIYPVLQEFIVLFATVMILDFNRCKSDNTHTNDLCSAVFDYMKELKFIQALTVIISNVTASLPTTMIGVKKFFLLMCSINQGRFFLTHAYASINLITTLLIMESQADSPYYVLPLNELLSSESALIECSWADVGFTLVFSLQIVQFYDHLIAYHAKKDLTHHEALASLHQIVCIMSSDPGRYAALSFFSQGDALQAILPFIENHEHLNHDKNSQSSILQKYSSFILTKLLQRFDNVDFIIKNLSHFVKWMKKETDPHLCEVIAWLMPINNIKIFNINSCFILIHFILQALQEYNFNIQSARACSTALRLILEICNNYHPVELIHLENTTNAFYCSTRLIEFGVIEMMNKFASALNRVLSFSGCIRLNFPYIYAVHRSIMPFLTLNKMLFDSFTTINHFIYKQSYIVDLISLYAHVEWYKYLPISESMEDIQESINIFLNNLICANNDTKILVIKSIFFFLLEKPVNLSTGLSLFYKIVFMLFRKNEVLIVYLLKNVNTYDDILVNFTQDLHLLIDISISSNNDQLLSNLVCLCVCICQIGSTCAQAITQCFINLLERPDYSHIQKYNSLAFLSSLSVLPKLNNLTNKLIFEDEKNKFITIITYLQTLAISPSFNNNILACIFNYIFYLIKIHIIFSKNQFVTLTKSSHINLLFDEILRSLDSEIFFSILIQILKDRLYYKIFITYFINSLPKFKNFSIKLLESTQESREIEDFKKNIFNEIKKITKKTINKNFNIDQVVEFFSQRSLTYNNSFTIIDDSINNWENHSSVQEVKMDLCKIFEFCQPNFDFKQELIQFFKLKKNPGMRGERRRRFDPLLNMDHLISNDGCDYKIGSNFRDNKLRSFVEAFKTKRALTSRLPSLHVDDYAVFHKANIKHTTNTSLLPPLMNPAALFSLLPSIRPEIAMNATALLKNILGRSFTNTK